jgi:hypothetical protein
VGEWRFEVEAEHPAYVWNRVVTYVIHGHLTLETREFGTLTLSPGRPEAPEEADGYRFFTGRSILGRAADDRLCRVVNWGIEPMSAHRLAVHVYTFVDEAEAYVAAMLNTLGYRARMMEAAETPRDRPCVPSAEVQERAKLFLEILRKSPHYRQDQVAKAAAERYWQAQGGEERPQWTRHTVQNAFRAMGWHWREEKERALHNR